MELETLGHASLLIRDDRGAPVLLTDPWLTGSCYWRSWWLQNYPDAALLDEARHAQYCLITHEHPDHFHTATIRTLDRGVRFLAPSLPEEHIAAYLAGQGRPAAIVPPLEWQTLAPGIRILSIPLFNDDSALLVDTPDAFIVNLNDAKPRRGQLRQLRRDLDARVPRKTRILLSSYSPASIVNSFTRNAERVSLRDKRNYVEYVCDNCDSLNADFYIPFASQVIYRRTDSAWANAFKVTEADLRAHWRARATLLPPFVRMNLRDRSFSFVPPERYNPRELEASVKVKEQETVEAAAAFTGADVEALRRKLNVCRWFLAAFFPRGIGFRLDRDTLRYNPWSGTITQGASAGDVVFHVPTHAFKDAITYGHFGDLGITMFTMVALNGRIHPRRVYLFFLIITMHDYQHTVSVGHFMAWLKSTLKVQNWKLPALAR
jgi:hypothetical protein